jgi:hypothetical protein
MHAVAGGDQSGKSADPGLRTGDGRPGETLRSENTDVHLHALKGSV